MSKHTPGPWQYRRSSTSSTDYYEIIPAGELGGWKDGRYLSVSGAIDEHDARLIAAAPDLLEAAEAIVARWDSPLWKDQPHTGTFIDQLRAAIAKAKGEQP